MNFFVHGVIARKPAILGQIASLVGAKSLSVATDDSLIWGISVQNLPLKTYTGYADKTDYGRIYDRFGRVGTQ